MYTIALYVLLCTSPSEQEEQLAFDECAKVEREYMGKIARAEELYKKAVNVKPTQPDEDDSDLYTELPEDEGVYEVRTNVSAQRESDIGKTVGVAWIDELSHSNSLKKPLKIACTVTRILVRWSQQAATYYRTLKEV